MDNMDNAFNGASGDYDLQVESTESLTRRERTEEFRVTNPRLPLTRTSSDSWRPEDSEKAKWKPLEKSGLHYCPRVRTNSV